MSDPRDNLIDEDEDSSDDEEYDTDEEDEDDNDEEEENKDQPTEAQQKAAIRLLSLLEFHNICIQYLELANKITEEEKLGSEFNTYISYCQQYYLILQIYIKSDKSRYNERDVLDYMKKQIESLQKEMKSNPEPESQKTEATSSQTDKSTETKSFDDMIFDLVLQLVDLASVVADLERELAKKSKSPIIYDNYLLFCQDTYEQHFNPYLKNNFPKMQLGDKYAWLKPKSIVFKNQENISEPDTTKEQTAFKNKFPPGLVTIWRNWPVWTQLRRDVLKSFVLTVPFESSLKMENYSNFYLNSIRALYQKYVFNEFMDNLTVESKGQQTAFLLKCYWNNNPKLEMKMVMASNMDQTVFESLKNAFSGLSKWILEQGSNPLMGVSSIMPKLKTESIQKKKILISVPSPEADFSTKFNFWMFLHQQRNSLGPVTKTYYQNHVKRILESNASLWRFDVEMEKIVYWGFQPEIQNEYKQTQLQLSMTNLADAFDKPWRDKLMQVVPVAWRWLESIKSNAALSTHFEKWLKDL